MSRYQTPEHSSNAKKQKQTHTAVVLEEEEYRASIDSIIERDFFPDLQRLQAENQGKFIADFHPEATNAGTKQSLDEFLHTHTSEDNASFAKLLKSENQRREIAYQKKYSTNRRITAGSSDTLRRNALMFAPDGITVTRPTDEQRKMIVHKNTRLAEPCDVDDTESVASETTTAGYRTPEINGYKMVDSPGPRRRGFAIAPRTPRELAGLRLASQKSTTPRRASSKQTDMLSPAAQRLLGRSQKTREGGLSANDSLRSAYNSPYVRRPD